MWAWIFIILVTQADCLRNYSKHKAKILKKEVQHDGNLTYAITDIALGLPATHIILLFDKFKNPHFPENISKSLHNVGISTSIYIIDTEKNQEKIQKVNNFLQYCQYMKDSMSKYESLTSLIFSTRNTAVDLFWMIQQQDLIHRKLLYMFYWGNKPIETSFTADHFEAMRIAVISNPRPGTYRIYYSQANATDNNLHLVNWWSVANGLFSNPVLPLPFKVYQNFDGREFEVPVLHKPPWHFVEYANDSFNPGGGRDDKLLTVIATKLNFKYHYVDPPERIQGSAMYKNGSFPGVLGQVYQRNYDFFMGDVTITYERSKGVEFSFLTLVDSEAFVTHRPSKLNEALALIRPFHWQVWPPIVAMIALYGPILFFIIEAPSMWVRKKDVKKSRWKLFWDCVWFSTSTFLRQGGAQPASSHKVRLVLIIVTLGATYVIGDMYSANLTSLLARPGREKPITILEQLELAMSTRGYELLVEKHSSSYSTLQNGTGIYRRLWRKMQTQKQSVIESVEVGMKLVRERKNFAVLGGRETLFFDTKRFGPYNFHLSEKLNTRYSAIAMQQGCPYIENFNRILMQLFEGGILTKMTEEEYEKLGEKLRAAAGIGETDEQIKEARQEVQERGESSDPQSGIGDVQEGEASTQTADNEHQLQPLSIRMLQGAFYMLVIGYFVSAIVLTLEINAKHIKKLLRKLKCEKCHGLIKKSDCTKWKNSLFDLWFDLFVEPLKDLMEDEVTGMERKQKKKELIDKNENITVNEEIDYEHPFPYLE